MPVTVVARCGPWIVGRLPYALPQSRCQRGGGDVVAMVVHQRQVVGHRGPDVVAVPDGHSPHASFGRDGKHAPDDRAIT
ncbi:hypothetical protein ABZ027_06210 [Streptomyces sp. NPDC006332]|uniref:hypothetical protein n=1 Tax=Streptomyces sp. NPDC006332 TaxID=3155456 RepID=UPI0033BE5375